MIRVRADETVIGSNYLLYLLHIGPVNPEYMMRNAIGASWKHAENQSKMS